MSNGVHHLAIIMDGNRRWAKSHGLPSLEGHRRGYDKLRQLVEWCLVRHIPTVTVFAFSTENWNRSVEEVTYLMQLLEFALTKERAHFKERGVRLRLLGRREGLPETVRRAADAAEQDTAENTSILLQLAINYGGRAEIIDAANAAIAGQQIVTEDSFRAFLYAPEVPDPDLIIRTGGEQRLSGFLLWEAAYSELYFAEKHWPDFSEGDLDQALTVYAERERRFGK